MGKQLGTCLSSLLVCLGISISLCLVSIPVISERNRDLAILMLGHGFVSFVLLTVSALLIELTKKFLRVPKKWKTYVDVIELMLLLLIGLMLLALLAREVWLQFPVGNK